MVGSAGTCQPAAATRRSEARRRARPVNDAGVPGVYKQNDTLAGGRPHPPSLRAGHGSPSYRFIRWLLVIPLNKRLPSKSDEGSAEHLAS